MEVWLSVILGGLGLMIVFTRIPKSHTRACRLFGVFTISCCISLLNHTFALWLILKQGCILGTASNAIIRTIIDSIGGELAMLTWIGIMVIIMLIGLWVMIRLRRGAS